MSYEEKIKEREFKEYISLFKREKINKTRIPASRIADSRQAFLEFSQYRNLEFDTLRKAKYSTSVLLLHLHDDNTPGLIPTCSVCNHTIRDIRWHRVRRVDERHHTGRVPPTLRPTKMTQTTIASSDAEACHMGEELCASCYDKRLSKDEFIPLPVSIRDKL